MTTIEVTQRKSGAYSLVLHRPGMADSIVRSGIATHAEAVTRAKVWRDLCGYQLKGAK